MTFRHPGRVKLMTEFLCDAFDAGVDPIAAIKALEAEGGFTVRVNPATAEVKVTGTPPSTTEAWVEVIWRTRSHLGL